MIPRNWSWLDHLSKALSLRAIYGGKPRVLGDKAKMKNALQKIRSMVPVPDPEHPNHRLSDIIEVADKALGYKRSYHTQDKYLEPGVRV